MLDLTKGSKKKQNFNREVHPSVKKAFCVRRFAIKLIQKAKKNGWIVEGKDPKGIAAAAIYLSSLYFQCPKTQKEIAKMAHKTDFTLRLRCQELKKFAIASCFPTISHP